MGWFFNPASDFYSTRIWKKYTKYKCLFCWWFVDLAVQLWSNIHFVCLSSNLKHCILQGHFLLRLRKFSRQYPLLKVCLCGHFYHGNERQERSYFHWFVKLNDIVRSQVSILKGCNKIVWKLIVVLFLFAVERYSWYSLCCITKIMFLAYRIWDFWGSQNLNFSFHAPKINR